MKMFFKLCRQSVLRSSHPMPPAPTSSARVDEKSILTCPPLSVFCEISPKVHLFVHVRCGTMRNGEGYTGIDFMWEF